MSNIKKFVEQQLAFARHTSKDRTDMLDACTFCVGAIQYAYDNGEITMNEIANWWPEIRSQFEYGDFGTFSDADLKKIRS